MMHWWIWKDIGHSKVNEAFYEYSLTSDKLQPGQVLLWTWSLTALDQETKMGIALEKSFSNPKTRLWSLNYGKMELKTRKTSGMSAVESHTVISQVLQLKSGLLLDVVYRYGSHYNFYNRHNKDGQCAQSRNKDGQ